MPHGLKLGYIKIKIAKTYIQMRNQDSKVTAKEVKKAVQEELHKSNPNLPDDWPGLSAVQKVITDYRKGESEQPSEQKALDQPWRVLDIAKHPIPPETLPIILEAWGRGILKNSPLTIRVVLWIARLYYVFKERKSTIPIIIPDGEETLPRDDGIPASDDVSVITGEAKVYAMEELLYERTGGYSGKPDELWWAWFMDGQMYTMFTGEFKVGRHITRVLKKRGPAWFHFPEDLRAEVGDKMFGKQREQ